MAALKRSSFTIQDSSEINSIFKLTWKIHNFTMMPYKAGEPLWSPTIVIDLFAGTEWNIGLYVRGYKNEDYITGIVYRGKSEEGAEKIPLSLAISFKNTDGSSSLICEKNYDFDSDKGYGFQLIPQSEVFKKKKYLYPGDTLIIEYQMRKYEVESPASMQSVFRNYAFDSKFASRQALDGMKKALKPEVSKCLIRTRINVEELRFVWAIPRFCTVKLNQKLSVPICFVGKNSAEFVLSIIPNISTKQPEESMQIELSAKSKESFYCLYEILLVDSDFVSRIHMKGEHLFEAGSSMSHNVPNSLKWSEIQRNKHLRLVDETLTLYYKIEIASSSSVKSFIEQTAYFPPKFGVYSLTSDEDETPNDQIMEHNKERKFCDVSLQVEGKLLRTHKIILCTWSSVFKTILEQDLSEDCNILDIDDIDIETVDRMLIFMYTQTVEDLDWKEAAKLYLAANKYKINLLLENCSRSLQSKISLSNVCDLLFLADAYANEELVKFATDFIKTHKDEVLRTEQWKKLMEDKGALAAKLMHEMFVEI